MLKIRYGSRFKRDFKRCRERKDCKIEKFKEVLNYLVSEKPLPVEYNDHKLIGDYRGYRECHIMPDWLLVYRVEKKILTLVLLRTGSHSDIF